MPAIVFFGIATLVAVVSRAVGELRWRAVARRADPASPELCELGKANRITSGLGVGSGIGLVLAVLAALL